MKCSSYAVVVPVALAAGLALAQRPVIQVPGTRPGHVAPVLIRWVSSSARGVMSGAMKAPQQRGYSASQHGSQGYLGIDIRDVSDDRLSALKLHESRGAEIIHVDHDGPAGKAGLREHDVVLQINGQVIEGEEQVRRILRETPAGRTITIVLSRDGQQQTISTQMADRATVEREAWEQRTVVPQPPPPSGIGNSFFGSTPVVSPPITAPPDPRSHSFIGSVILGSSYTGAALELIGPQLAQYFGSQGGNGLLVRSVDPNSPAATAGLRAGDVVVRANSIIIGGLGEWSHLVRENKGRPLSIVIVRDKQEQTLVLVPDSRKRSSIDLDSIPLQLRPSNEEALDLNCAFLFMN
jgi:serine protease Do